MNINCSLLEEQINQLRELINKELNTTPYIVDCLIARLLNDLMQDYKSNYASEILYWKEMIKIIKAQIVEGDTDETSRTEGNS
ncbi:MAG: hypothetical protein ACRC2R_16895 [Xenococcaceae cyanobacterium]